MAPDSKMVSPLSVSTIAGMRLFGLSFKKSGANCSPLPMSTGTTRYGTSASSKKMETLNPFGVGHA